MNVLFKDLTVGAVVYALVKGEELKYYEGSIISVGQQRMELPNVEPNPNPYQMPSARNVVDVTYQIDGKNYTDAVDVTASVFPSEKPGGVTLISTDKDAIIRELHATQKNSENYLAEAEKNVPIQKTRIKECKMLIAKLDTVYQERQQTEERFAKIEELQKEFGSKLDCIIAKLSEK